MNHFLVSRDRQSSAENFRGKPALSISGVSALWRKNAISLPGIWSRITLEWSYKPDPGYLDVAREKYRHDEQVHEKVLFTLNNFLNRSQ